MRTSGKHLVRGAVCLAAIFTGMAMAEQTPGAIRVLDPAPVVVAESPEPETTAMYTPSIHSAGGGRLVASYTIANRIAKKGHTVIVTSDDGGKTWVKRAESPTNQGRIFAAGGKTYYFATRYYPSPGSNPKGMPMCIQTSDDKGTTWSEPFDLDKRTWHQTAANVLLAKGNVYLVMERHTINNIRSWKVGALAPVLMRAKETDDLTKPESWTYASELTFQDQIPGYRENDPDLDYFGIPVYKMNFPRGTVVTEKERFPPMGWLETNVVRITDPDHVWHDPEGKTFHLVARTHTGMTNYAALAKVTENDDGTMTTSLVTAPSGKKLFYFPMPGGHMRFHVVYDEKTKLYWMVGSQSTDSMVKPDRVPEGRYGLGDNERHRMVLHFSKNMVDWCFAGLVDIGRSVKESRHYASMDIDGDDLIILSRSGDERASSAHDGNLVLLHRVKGFRGLVY